MARAFEIGLVGGGMWGRVHLDGVRDLGAERCRARWICSRTPENVRELQSEYAIPNGTSDLAEMLADDELDAVIVSTPPFLHAEQAIAVLEAGKHLLLEKPMATTHADARRIVDAAAAHPELVTLEASCRFTTITPKYAFVKELIDSGRIGRVYHVHHHEMKPTTFVQYNPRAKDWAADPQRAGGGPVIDWGPYDFAFHFGLMGNPTPVRAVAATGLVESGIERHAIAIVDFGDGLSYQFERVSGAPYREASTTRIHGTRGTLRFGYQPWEPKEIELSTLSDSGELVTETLVCEYERPRHENTYLLEHFLDCLAGKATPIMPFGLAAANLDVSFAVLDAIRARG